MRYLQSPFSYYLDTFFIFYLSLYIFSMSVYLNHREMVRSEIESGVSSVCRITSYLELGSMY